MVHRLVSLRQGAVGAGLLVAGLGIGAVAGHAARPAIEMAPLHPTAIHALADGGGIVSVRARVAELFGNKAVLDDGSGRALADLGPAGDDHPLVAAGQVVTVQGRFDHGLLHASFLVDGAGKVQALGPVNGPRHGPDGPPPPSPHGPGAPPPGGPALPPPPPPGAAPAAG